MALSTRSPLVPVLLAGICSLATFSRLFKSCLAAERLPRGFFLSQRVLPCFVSLRMETVQCCSWHLLSFCLCFLLLCALFLRLSARAPRLFGWCSEGDTGMAGGAPEQMWEDRNRPGHCLSLPELHCTFSDPSDEQNLLSLCRKM